MAQALGTPCIIVDCDAPIAELERRLVLRSTSKQQPSEADLKVLQAQTTRAEALSVEERTAALSIDKTQSPDFEALAELLRGRRFVGPA